MYVDGRVGGQQPAKQRSPAVVRPAVNLVPGPCATGQPSCPAPTCRHKRWSVGWLIGPPLPNLCSRNGVRDRYRAAVSGQRRLHTRTENEALVGMRPELTDAMRPSIVDAHRICNRRECHAVSRMFYKTKTLAVWRRVWCRSPRSAWLSAIRPHLLFTARLGANNHPAHWPRSEQLI